MPVSLNTSISHTNYNRAETASASTQEKKSEEKPKAESNEQNKESDTVKNRNPNIKEATPEEIRGKALSSLSKGLNKEIFSANNEHKKDHDLTIAKHYGNKADEAQSTLRNKQKGSPDNSEKMLLKDAISIVLNRNKELEKIGEFTAKADMNSPHNGAYFWSGSTIKNGEVIHSAMLTAQSMAEKNSGTTLEMTQGGHALHNYSGEADSFSYLKERFKYTSGTESSPENYAPRKELIEKGINSSGVDMLAETGLAKTGAKALIPTPKDSVPHILWDMMSMRYANNVSGEATAIHAVSADDPYIKSDAYQQNTWNMKEKPILTSNNVTIKEKFSEQLQGELVGGKEQHKTNWSNTGGFKGNVDTGSKT
ncbi:MULTISPECIES: hypothetical protein [Pectobacterium]|uniref:hypothetical protein n=1 Tax=Pectobacterium TaxID=122277 RepID=UPI0015F0F4A0|nr:MULTISPECIES: hypothetical protein [Pectobacterium]MBA5235167.1 hypothetical protein [Pectobacterium aroidearum]MBG0750537.1 hypothetical protein [Pectobacterium carotovorum subsp. carotovorum PCCS1]UUE38331.1 hypothetical protein L0Y26_10595 [Pectobacterium aroidearum]UUE42706.1 hypothetical protein L0Y25_10600 [Pectobacterium aroidearum]UUE43272.1 hypothetical protein L0Y28_11815 [Pectobacterium aroidearum]